MDAKAPITQDVLTIPRKLPEGPTNLEIGRASCRERVS